MRAPSLLWRCPSCPALQVRGSRQEPVTAEASPAPPTPFLSSEIFFSSWEPCKTATEFGGCARGLPWVSLSPHFPSSFLSTISKSFSPPPEDAVWERMGALPRPTGRRSVSSANLPWRTSDPAPHIFSLWGKREFLPLLSLPHPWALRPAHRHLRGCREASACRSQLLFPLIAPLQ